MCLEKIKEETPRLSKESWVFRHSLTLPGLGGSLLGRLSPLVDSEPIRKWLDHPFEGVAKIFTGLDNLTWIIEGGRIKRYKLVVKRRNWHLKCGTSLVIVH